MVSNLKIYGDFKEQIKAEDLNPQYFLHEAEGIVQELKKQYSHFPYINEKLRHLEGLREIACRATIKEKRGMKEGFPASNDPEVLKCIEQLKER